MNVELKKCQEKDVLCMVGCSNIADFNTGVSLHSFPVLKESARYFVGDFAICSIQVFALGVQYRCLVINGNSSHGRFRKYGKILGKKKQFQEIWWEIQANQVDVK